jgi:uncharacterized damage-inducible protein DinB
MMKALTVVVCAGMAVPAFAQQTLGEMFNKHWQVAREFTIAVAEMMPEDSYDFKPNPEEMGFGQLMFHIASSNASYYAAVAGTKSPITKPANFDKATVMKILNQSFDFCANTQISDEQAGAMIGPAGRQMTGRERLWAAFTHMAHHRGQAEVYLRVKGIKPPPYRF